LNAIVARYVTSGNPITGIAGFLRASSKWRDQEAACNAANEFSSIHHQITSSVHASRRFYAHPTGVQPARERASFLQTRTDR
jgi:hypothetical protein